uniref:Uncharacterized protein n=1 Tax=Stomoxys calcitrans TaxID=35570 RepID=A0A1I8Q9A3_STOCA
MPSVNVQLNLNIGVDVLTAGSMVEVVNAILESLLYQRNQIPFVYQTYRYYVNKWKENDFKQAECADLNFQVQRQRSNAKNTKDSICAMRRVIDEAFKWKLVKTLRFLFGGTVFTPKECYTIHIPTDDILRNHYSENHRIPLSKLNGTLLSLLTHEDLYSIFSHNLSTTNMYLEFELMDYPAVLLPNSSPSPRCKIFPKDFLAPPPSCKEVHIHIHHKRNNDIDYTRLKCCKELNVFEDLVKLNLGENDLRGTDLKDNSLLILEESNSEWWESEIVVRGFKEKTTTGFDMWS